MSKIENFEGFRQLLDEAEAIHGKKKKTVAEGLGIDQSHYTKLYKGEAYALNVPNCLRLAKLISRPPAEVLRAAGKGDVADLLDDLYGVQHYAPLPGGAQGRELAAEWGRLTSDQRAAVLTLIRHMPRLPAESRDVAPEPVKKAARNARR